MSTNGWFMIAYGLREEIYINNNISRPFSNNTIIIHNNLQRLSSFISPLPFLLTAPFEHDTSHPIRAEPKVTTISFSQQKISTPCKMLFISSQPKSIGSNTTPAPEWLTYGVTVFCELLLCELLFMISCQHQDY